MAATVPHCVAIALLTMSALGCEAPLDPSVEVSAPGSTATLPATLQSGEPILAGPPGPAADPTQVAAIPTKAQVDAWLNGYVDQLTEAEAAASLLPKAQLPGEQLLQALLDTDALSEFDDAALHKADLSRFVPKALFPNPAVQPLMPKDEAEGTFLTLEEAQPYLELAVKSDIASASLYLQAESAVENYEPTGATDGLATAADVSSLQRKDEPLSPALVKAARDRIRHLRRTTVCPTGMVGIADFCIDVYEASVWSEPACKGTQYGLSNQLAQAFPSTFPASGDVAPQHRLYACSLPGYMPARLITWFQAQQACTASGKRLCSNAEWQLAAIGTPASADDCSYGGTTSFPQLRPSIQGGGCVSAYGIQDAAGNVAEWVGDWALGYHGIGPRWADATNFTQPNPWPGTFGDGSDSTMGINGRTRIDPASQQNGLPAAGIRGGSAVDGEGPSGAHFIDWSWAPSAARQDLGFRCCAPRY